MGFTQFLITLLRSLFLPNSLRTWEWKMLRLVNKERKVHRLAPLFMQEDLRRVARAHSRDMAQKDYFEHENLIGQNHADRLKEAQISEVVSGENLAKMGGYTFPLERAHKGLMNSPGHQANILHPAYNSVGIGIHKSETQIYYFTQNFAHRTLIFTKNPPEKVNIKKGLKLTFKAIEKVNYGVYRIKTGLETVLEKGFPIKEGKNTLLLTFAELGRHEIELFTGQGQHLKLSNHITVSVRRGWFS